VAPDRHKRWAVVNTMMNHEVPQNRGVSRLAEELVILPDLSKDCAFETSGSTSPMTLQRFGRPESIVR
jgi:hypothetical protein